MLVVDASALADLLLPTSRGALVRDIVDDHMIHAPQLASIEVASVLRTSLNRGEIDHVRATSVLRDLDALGIEWYDHEPFLGRVLELRSVLSAYDALYVALAEALAVPLVTSDRRLARSHGHDADIRLAN